MTSRLMVALLVAGCCAVTVTGTAAAAIPDAKPSARIVLGENGLGVASFGATATTKAIATALGNPTGHPESGCDRTYTETAWRDLVVQFVSGRFEGYRYTIPNPYGTGAPAALRSATPRLSTVAGITLGDTLAEAKRAYPSLRQSGTDFWKTSSSIVAIVFGVYNPSGHVSPTAQIYEIKNSTCPGSV